MATRKRSEVWLYFEKHEYIAAKVVCQICSDMVIHSGNTSNMLKHLKSKHESEYSELENKKKKELEQSETPITSKTKPISLLDSFSRTGADGKYPDMKAPKERKTRPRSVVWDHFTRDVEDPGLVICNHCLDEVRRANGTSNMLKHLERKHPEELNRTQLDTSNSSPTPTSDDENYINGDVAPQQNIQVCKGSNDESDIHAPLITFEDNTFTVIGECPVEGRSEVGRETAEKKFSSKRRFSRDCSSESKLKVDCMRLQKEKLILEISKLETETIFSKEKLKLEIEKLKEEREKAKADKELAKLSVMKAKREMGIRDGKD